ncbi:peptidoglycan DD-metalloendopeptidase family protein [Marilutibacter chinensis]|uniref:Peptidoglycan DD-metalloendopeptidase family protein n=1 Tax=Marilutibacter chinensis TaxID=2912247 RepID=A0ABS9HQW9_9GAMM|nr:peptidoglycan DD-metalloendopeptidase family protein [Lysobacter chinensis]MCF7220550.1 peptidoglycan DD-metalloendopeptidase family protein [Lysobacter chinensis]
MNIRILHRHGLWLGACVLLGAVPSVAAAQTRAPTALATIPMERSKGVYRIPYADDTRIRVSRDHNTHTPKGRYDIGGQGGGSHRIVAAADGHVRYIEDRFSQRLDCDGLAASEKKNNYVWIEHANGEWSKYSHMQRNSTTGKAGLEVGDFVRAGTYLGDEGDVGCAGGDHLHFEVALPRATDPITIVGGFLRDNAGSKRNRIARVCGVDNGVFAAGRSYTARRVPGVIAPGAKEVARHGVPARDYQCLFDQAVAAGYMLEWIDGFDVNGNVYYNAIFRPGSGAWAAFHGLSGSQYQQRFDQYTGQGYRPYQVESYAGSSGVRYAVIFRKQPGPAYSAYHGLGAGAHQARMDALSQAGYRPRNVSVASVGGERRYAALYEKADIGSWQAKSQLSATQYQQAFDANAQAGRRLVYVNAYVHGGQPYFSAIWSSKASATYRARHGLTGSQYQNEWESTTQAGYLTRDVTGYAVGNSARYAAIWRK